MKTTKENNEKLSWNLLYYIILHGTLGNIGNILSNISITYEIDIKNFIDHKNNTINKDDVDNFEISSFALTSIFGQLFICFIFHKLVINFGSSFSWIFIRHYLVIAACLLMILAKIEGLSIILLFSQFLFGANSFFILPQSVFIGECGSFNKRASVILNINTANMFISVIITSLTPKEILINEENWHYIYVIGIASSTCYLLLLNDIKETPKYLFFINPNFQKIYESLIFYRKENIDIEKEIDNYENEVSMYKKRLSMTISEILNLKNMRKRIFLILLGEISQKISLYIILSPYIEKILNYLNLPLFYTSSIIIGLQLGGLAASMLSSVISEQFSRKKLFITFIILSGISFKIMFLGILFQNVHESNLFSQIVCILALYLSTVISNIGHNCITPILINDIIPIHGKVAAIQILSIFSNMIQVYLIITFVPLYNLLGSGIFLSYNFFITISMFLLVKYLPDTSDKMVYQIFNDYEEL
uniref:MFS domain-containing protein n=1 Tax=Parastrongyloides trichosuri TaxID=131310 RepID=A0A0N4ZP55_PARTI